MKKPTSGFARAMRDLSYTIKRYDCDGMHQALDDAQHKARTVKQRDAIFKALQKISRLCVR